MSAMMTVRTSPTPAHGIRRHRQPMEPLSDDESPHHAAASPSSVPGIVLPGKFAAPIGRNGAV